MWEERGEGEGGERGRGSVQAYNAYVFGGDAGLQQLVQQLAHDRCLGSVGDAAAGHDGFAGGCRG